MLDNYPAEDEPDGDVSLPHHFWIGVAVSSFGFGMVWPAYPRVGATLTLLGLAIAADDTVEHTFDVPTPLDQLYKRWLRPLLERVEDE